MGQKPSSECGCQEMGLFQLCAPEDPRKEDHGQITTPSYPNSSGAPRSTSGGGAPQTAGPSSPPSYAQAQGTAGQEGAGFFFPPPDEPSQGVAPSPPAATRTVTADDILSNLEGSEDVVYGQVFDRFPGGSRGAVGLDCMPMRDFLATNSCCGTDDIDMELLKVASPDDGLTRDGFLHLLREFAVSDGDVIGHFMGLSANGETLAAEECRSGLLLFMQQKLSMNFSDDRWENIFNAVLWDAGVTVPMEQWMRYCKTTARTVRLLDYARV